jgi:hypothetical protein
MVISVVAYLVSFKDHSDDDVWMKPHTLSNEKKRRFDIEALQFIQKATCHHWMRTVIKCKRNPWLEPITFNNLRYPDPTLPFSHQATRYQ